MSIVSIPADPTPGAAPSPWALNGNDLYPDSTSYIVGIGTDNPDTLLHLKATDGTPKIKLEGTNYDYTIEVDANHSASQNSSLLRFESDTFYAANEIEFKNGSSTGTSSISMYLTAKGASSLFFYDGDLNAPTGKAKAVLTTNFSTDRLYLYGEDGYAGGMLTMDFSQANDARFAFGYGDEALSNAARLAIKHTSSPQLLLDDGTSNTTFKHEDNSGAPRVTVSGGMNLTGANNNTTLRLSQAGSSTTYKLVEFKNDAATTESIAPYIYPDSASGYTRVRFKGSGATTPFIFDDGVAFRGGGNAIQFDGGSANIGTTGVTMRVEVNTGFGLATSNFTPSGAMLHIKDASNAQLKLDDGSENTTLKTTTDALIVHQDSNWDFKIDANAGANANLRFSEAGTTKAGLAHLGATESGLVQRTGFFRDSITAASGATVAINATTTGNVIACDTTSNAITATLPAVANYAGAVVYVIDSKGNAGATSRAITIAVQTGEKLDGVLNGTATISSNNGFSVLVCTADGWFQVG